MPDCVSARCHLRHFKAGTSLLVRLSIGEEWCDLIDFAVMRSHDMMNSFTEIERSGNSLAFVVRRRIVVDESLAAGKRL